MRIYAQTRKAFLEEWPVCMVHLERNGCDPRSEAAHAAGILVGLPWSTEVHHMAGRTGKNYLDETTWLAVCREAHEWIHNNPSAARAKGFLL